MEKIKEELLNSLNYLENINNKNFNVNLKKAENSFKKALYLRSEFDDQQFKNDINFSKLKNIAKQIENRFDNLIESRKNTQEGILKEINMLGNKKRLTNYQR